MLLDIPAPSFVGERRRESPLGDPSEYELAAASNRAVRNSLRRKRRGGGARIEGQTRMQIVYRAVAEFPGITPKRIGFITHLNPSPVYVALRQLRASGHVEARGPAHYVTAKPAPVDRRGENWTPGIQAIAEMRRAA